jgi:MOSC domain-containing protein YiiM
MILVRHLYISPGHNYFGHKGLPAGTHPIIESPRIECVAGRGVRGDRFFDFKPDYKGQITFFADEILAALCQELHLSQVDPSSVRRNVITFGVDLNDLIGVEFEIQGVRLLGVEECRPCYWMNQAVHPEAETWLKGRGGLRAKILTDGILTPENELE